MIRQGDAIEVKKTQSEKSDLALNSSYPKSNIQANSTMITNECRTCENWTEKDLIYFVGHKDDESVNSLWMVYGNIYAAKNEKYQIIKQKITELWRQHFVMPICLQACRKKSIDTYLRYKI